MDNYLHLPFLRSSPIDLVITRYPEVFSIVPRILCAYCLAVLCHMNTPSNKSSHLSSIRLSPDDPCISQKSSKYYSILQKSLAAYCSPSTCLLALWILSICLAIFTTILCHRHFGSVDSICCECSQSSTRS